MNAELIAILDGREAGRVARETSGRLYFIYNEDWRTSENAYPLSISMPVALARHGHAKIDPFLWGLLPDNEMVLDRWAQKFHVSARKLAEELGLDPDELVHRVDEIARQTADYVPDVRRRVTEDGLPHPIVARLADALVARAAACRAILG